MHYQAHIDGLRAIAVLSVIFYHLDIAGFSGGFVGVDVFFVISGYLISGLILKEIENTGSFSFKHFYLRRARRLLPAFITTLALSSLLALGLFSSQALQAYGEEMLAALTSLANLYYWLNSGYFSPEADTRTLLHTWSLSVEEQFYLIWPLVLFLIYRAFGTATIPAALRILFLISLAMNIVFVVTELEWFPQQSGSIFFLTPFRAYEFLIGAAAVFIRKRISIADHFQELLFLFGAISLILVIGQYQIFLSTTQYEPLTPGTLLSSNLFRDTFLASIATLALILTEQSKLSRTLIQSSWIVFIGCLSYTLYLVHWPVLVFLQYYLFADVTGLNVLIALAMTGGISLLIYFYIEKPIRFANRHMNNSKSDSLDNNTYIFQYNRLFILSCFSSMVLLALVSIILVYSNGLSRFKSETYPIDQRYAKLSTACEIDHLESSNCDLSLPNQILVLGDSHALDAYNIISEMQITNGANTRSNIIYLGSLSSCKPAINADGLLLANTVEASCQNRIAQINETSFIDKLDAVIYGANRPFSKQKNNYLNIVEHFQKQKPAIKVFVMGGYVNTRRNCTEIANRYGGADACLRSEFISYSRQQERFDQAAFDSSDSRLIYTYLDKFRVLCASKEVNTETCEASHNGEPMFYDQHHLSVGFARLIGHRFANYYGDIIK